MDKFTLKQTIVEAMKSELDEKIAMDQEMIQRCRESANNDTKSSAGDKYETNRAMMHIEQEKYTEQLEENLDLKRKLSQIDISLEYDAVKTGAVVETSLGNFFIGLSANDIEIDDEEYTPISLASPLGSALKGLHENESTTFRGKKVSVYSVC